MQAAYRSRDAQIRGFMEAAYGCYDALECSSNHRTILTCYCFCTKRLPYLTGVEDAERRFAGNGFLPACNAVIIGATILSFSLERAAIDCNCSSAAGKFFCFAYTAARK